jgi:hypothetical protein
VEHAPVVPDCQDLSHAHIIIANDLWFDDSVSLINHDSVIIRKGIIFKTMRQLRFGWWSMLCSIIVCSS